MHPLFNKPLLFALAGAVMSVAAGQSIGLPTSGAVTSKNRYIARFTPVLNLDFEDDSALPANAPLTTDAIEGRSSLLLVAPARFEIPAALLKLQQGRTYSIDYDYRLPGGLSTDRELGESGGLILERDGADPVAIGRSPGDLNEATGTIHTGLRLDSPQVRLVFVANRSSIIIDRVRISRADVDVVRARVPLWTGGFPRLGNYSLTNPSEVSVRSGVPASEVEQTLALYDFLTGTDIDHTTGAAGWVRELRRLNPAIRLLPYHNSFALSFSGIASPIPGTGIDRLFAQGAADEWFAKSPAGTRLAEPDYPFIFQMNHSRFCPLVDGRTFTSYSLDFLANTVLSTGLWDGVHFDQPEWYPNPLLNPRSAPADADFPPIDLNGDGVAETKAELYGTWGEAFQDFFASVRRRFGFSQLIFGNAGYIPSNPKVLPSLNGFMREVFSPYKIESNGEWDTDNAAGWYRIYQNYSIADTVARAPQMSALEFMGSGLGTPNGKLTANGLPDRTTELTARDYRRVRLGLTTALLGNGFFEYDLTDNTTAPLWFDEFAVDSSGSAVRSLSGKGYLGQPLGAPQELAGSSRVIFWADFDQVSLPSWVLTSPRARASTGADETVDGSKSLVVTRDASDSNGVVLITDPSTIELAPGRTYQLLADYKVLSYKPRIFQGLVGVSIESTTQPATIEQAGSLFQPDVSGAGQTGTLRTVVKVPARGYRAVVSILDDATISFDNIRLLDSPGGVFRRDFENGIVLVNPNPEPLSVSLAQISGPMNRTGIKRIRGQQAPAWNNGQTVTGSLVIPSGDGIVLLADRVAPPGMDAPRDLKLDGQRLTWTPVDQYVAGYLVRYGNDPGSLTREAATGRIASLQISELDLAPGWTYFASVAPVDFSGNIGPFSDGIMALAAGDRPGTAPDFMLSPETPYLVPGGYAVLYGAGLAGETNEVRGTLPTALAGTQVAVNGIPAALTFVSPRRIDFIVPWETAGNDAVLNVTANGTTSGDTLAAVLPLRPTIVTVAGFDAASDADGKALPVAAPGSTVQLAAYGLGRLLGAPPNGAIPADNWEAVVVSSITATLDGTPVEVLSARGSSVYAGVYQVAVRLPANATAGEHTLRLQSGPTNSNDATIRVALEVH